MDLDLKDISKLIDKEIELKIDDDCDYNSLIEAIEKRVEYLLDHEADLLFSFLYRLDVSEKKVSSAINQGDSQDTITALSKLILERQIQRLHTKKTIRQHPIKGWDW